MSELLKYKIYIDTTTRYEKHIKLVEVNNNNEKLVEEIDGDVDVVSELQRILTIHKITSKQIIGVIPNTGPGSFTGIKSGVTIANVINWALGIKPSTKPYLPQYGQEPNITPRKTA